MPPIIRSRLDVRGARSRSSHIDGYVRLESRATRTGCRVRQRPANSLWTARRSDVLSIKGRARLYSRNHAGPSGGTIAHWQDARCPASQTDDAQYQRPVVAVPDRRARTWPCSLCAGDLRHSSSRNPPLTVSATRARPASDRACSSLRWSWHGETRPDLPRSRARSFCRAPPGFFFPAGLGPGLDMALVIVPDRHARRAWLAVRRSSPASAALSELYGRSALGERTYVRFRRTARIISPRRSSHR